jgi:cytochrome P450
MGTPLPPGFPPGPSQDVAFELWKDPLALLDRLHAQHPHAGGVIGARLAGEPIVVVSDPLAAKTILVDEPDVYVKTGTAFFPGSSLTGNGLLVSDGPTWRRQRKLSNPAFRKAAIDKYTSTMKSCTEEVLFKGRRWRHGVIRDVYGDFNQLTLSITMQALFGGEGDSNDSEITECVQTALEYFAERGASPWGILIPEDFPTPQSLRFKAAVSRLDRAVYNIIARGRKRLEKVDEVGPNISEVPDNLLTALLVSKDDQTGLGMEDRALRDELMTLLVAGQETSAILLAWTCSYLATRPELQDCIAQELKHCSEKKSNLLLACILETLRLRPPAYLMGRCVCLSRGAILAGYHIPPKTTVLVSPWLMHRDARWWGDKADEFWPHRWMEDVEAATSFNSILAGAGGAYIPFGAGPRVCIGMGFAMVEALLILSSVLENFVLAPVPGQEALPKPDPRITLRPRSPVRLLLLERERERNN